MTKTLLMFCEFGKYVKCIILYCIFGLNRFLAEVFILPELFWILMHIPEIIEVDLNIWHKNVLYLRKQVGICMFVRIKQLSIFPKSNFKVKVQYFNNTGQFSKNQQMMPSRKNISRVPKFKKQRQFWWHVTSSGKFMH